MKTEQRRMLHFKQGSGENFCWKKKNMLKVRTCNVHNPLPELDHISVPAT